MQVVRHAAFMPIVGAQILRRNASNPQLSVFNAPILLARNLLT